MFKQLALLTHVYNAATAVARQVDSWRVLPEDILAQIEILIADDYSDIPLSIEKGHLPIRLFRITTDIPWNMAGAKNLLRTQATAPWLLFFDVDNHLPPEQMALLTHALDRLDPANLYMFQRSMEGGLVDPHINTFLVHRSIVDSVGGFDEDFCGHYGYEDVYFHHLLMQRKIDKVLLNDICYIQAINAATLDLSRDMSRNGQLIQDKSVQGLGTSASQIRFEWHEIGDDGKA